MKHAELRQAFYAYLKKSGHVDIGHAPLVLQGDATTLFTSSGMQPLVPYLSGKASHQSGTRLMNIQPCIRTQDIEEVGDNRHTTFFEMMGNWSIGDYSKEEELAWKWEFFTETLKLPKERLNITVFEGDASVPRDEESVSIWTRLGVREDHIFYCGAKSNWWSRSGPPEKMPPGEIGGPSSEIFYDFGTGPHSGPESDEDRFMEIGNSVFIQYQKAEDGSLQTLPQKNVDFGGGLERIAAALNDRPDVFTTDIFQPIVKHIEEATHRSYSEHSFDMRVIADHMRAATFLIRDGVIPSNKEHGYILRRLMRRAAIRMHRLCGGMHGLSMLSTCVSPIITSLKEIHFADEDGSHIIPVIDEEMKRFGSTLERGLREIEKRDTVDAAGAFELFQSFGFPFELTQELLQEKGQEVSREDFDAEVQKHRELSQSSSAGKFKGGLADSSDAVVKFHTATHLLHQALKDVFGSIIRQEGSNITQERLRFDTRLDRKPTEAEIKEVEDIMNAKITANLSVTHKTMPREEAEKLGASSFFREKYGDEVTVYFIGDYSKEFCGGPHVQNTAEIGPVTISKVKNIGAQLVRLYVTRGVAS